MRNKLGLLFLLFVFACASSGVRVKIHDTRIVGQPENVSTITTLNRAVVRGELNSDSIRQVFLKHNSSFVECAKKYNKMDSRLGGLRFQINSRGEVPRANFKTTERRTLFHKCIESATKQLKFPRPLGGRAVWVEQALGFTSL